MNCANQKQTAPGVLLEAALLTVLAAITSYPVQAAQQPPAMRTLAVVVGSNHSYEPRLQPLRYATTDAVKFAKMLNDVGKVAAEDIIVLKDLRLGSFHKALANLRADLAKPVYVPEAMAAIPKRDRYNKFVLYFSGHADYRGLHFRDGALAKKELHQLLESVPIATKIAVLDACFAGEFLRRGIEPAPSFHIPKVQFDVPSGSVFLSATSADNFAYESDDLGGGIFTHHLVKGLYGEADGNVDGLITIDEAYQYVYRETKIQNISLPQHRNQDPEFASQLQGHGAVVLSFPKFSNGRLAIDPAIRGVVTFYAERGLNLYTVRKTTSTQRIVALPEGAYTVTLASAASRHRGDVIVKRGQVKTLALSDLEQVTTPGQNLRKGLFYDPDLSISAGGLSGYAGSEADLYAYGFDAAWPFYYSQNFRWDFIFGLETHRTGAASREVSYEASGGQIGITAATNLRDDLNPFEAYAGITTGGMWYRHHRKAPYNDKLPATGINPTMVQRLGFLWSFHANILYGIEARRFHMRVNATNLGNHFQAGNGLMLRVLYRL